MAIHLSQVKSNNPLHQLTQYSENENNPSVYLMYLIRRDLNIILGNVNENIADHMAALVILCNHLLGAEVLMHSRDFLANPDNLLNLVNKNLKSKRKIDRFNRIFFDTFIATAEKLEKTDPEAALDLYSQCTGIAIVLNIPCEDSLSEVTKKIDELIPVVENVIKLKALTIDEVFSLIEIEAPKKKKKKKKKKKDPIQKITAEPEKKPEISIKTSTPSISVNNSIKLAVSQLVDNSSPTTEEKEVNLSQINARFITLLVYSNGKIVSRKVGAGQYPVLKKLLTILFLDARLKLVFNKALIIKYL